MSPRDDSLTISLAPALRREVARAAKGLGVTEGEFVCRAVRNELWTHAFNQSRRALAPKARAKGVYTDEDVFRIVS